MLIHNIIYVRSRLTFYTQLALVHFLKNTGSASYIKYLVRYVRFTNIFIQKSDKNHDFHLKSI